MKKPDKRDTINLIFSAFLILAFIVCAHFFSEYAANILDATLGTVISILIFAVFGFLVFYATRVGDGKAVKRFSVATLVILDIPSLYILIASLAPGLPFNDVFASSNGSLSVIVILASVALGYGIPYTFLSGYEIADEFVEQVETEMLEGGLEADLTDDENVGAEVEIETEAEIEVEAETDENEEIESEEQTEG